MSIQTLQKCKRDGDSLTLEMKRDNQNDPPILPVVATLFCFGAFMSGLMNGRIDGWTALFFCLVLVGLYYCIRTAFRETILTLDASTIKLESHYRGLAPAVKLFVLDTGEKESESEPESDSSSNFSFLNLFSGFINRIRPDRWRSVEIYDRKTLSMPVSRVVYLNRKLDPAALRISKVYRHETRLLFGSSRLNEYRHKWSISHETPEKMKELEEIVRKFLNEVPYKSVASENIVSANVKDYTVTKNEGLTGHGDEFQAENVREHKKRYQITHTESQTDGTNELLIVVERGAGLSSLIGRSSLFLYNACMVLFFLALIALFSFTWLYWETLETEVLDRLQGTTVQNVIPDKWKVDVRKAIDYFSSRELLERKALALTAESLLLLPVLLVLYLAFYTVLRWPFWAKWTLRVQKRPNREPAICLDCRTDRYLLRSPRADIVPFFSAKPATNRTNFMITGRTYGDFNPAWRAPFQVVAITSTRSFAIPVNDEEEQQEMIRILSDFAQANN